MPSEEQHVPHRHVFTLVVAFGLLFVFLELLKTYRSALWSGSTVVDWTGALVGLGVYVLVLGTLTELLCVVACRAKCRQASGAIAAPLCAVVAAAAVWAVLSAHREFVPTLDDALVATALVGLAAGAILLPALGLMSLRAVCGVACVALASGVVAVAAAGHVFLFRLDRASVVTQVAVGWASVAAISGLLAWGFPRKPLAKTRRIGISLLVIALPLVLAYVLLAPSPGSPGRKGPNLVFIIADTLRADCCSVYGGQCPTPSLEKLAQRGARFERCYALGPWTPPSMVGLFASTYPPGLTPGATRATWRDEIWRYALRARDGVLSELLAARGYRTAALLANPVLRGMGGMLRGFQTTCFSHPMIKTKCGLLNHCPFLQDTLAAWFPALIEERFQDTTSDLTRYGLEYLRRNRNRGFFLWVHYMDPHAPYDPPDQYRTRTGPFRAFSPNIGRAAEDADYTPLADFEPEHRPYVRSLYEAEVQYVDEAIGRVLAELERLGLADDTFVCVTSDHGEELWDHGGWGHGQSLYEELVRVPLIISGPRLSRQVVAEPVTALDLMPTLAELVGAVPSPSWLGTSLAPVVRSERPAPVSQPCFARGTGHRVQSEPLEMVVVGNHKLVRGAATGDAALYDLVQDPEERTDLAEPARDPADRCMGLIAECRADYPSTLDEFFAGEETYQNRQEMIRQFRAIGYLD